MKTVIFGMILILYFLFREPAQEERSVYYAEYEDKWMYAEAIPYPEVSFEDPYVFCIEGKVAEATKENKEAFKEECLYFFERNRQFKLYPDSDYPQFNIKQAYKGKFNMVETVTMKIKKRSDVDYDRKLSQEEMIGKG